MVNQINVWNSSKTIWGLFILFKSQSFNCLNIIKLESWNIQRRLAFGNSWNANGLLLMGKVHLILNYIVFCPHEMLFTLTVLLLADQNTAVQKDVKGNSTAKVKGHYSIFSSFEPPKPLLMSSRILHSIFS